MRSGKIRHEMTTKAEELRVRLVEDEEKKGEMRRSGRRLLDQADNILQGVEESLKSDYSGGAMTARPHGLNNHRALPEIIRKRPDTAEQ